MPFLHDEEVDDGSEKGIPVSSSISLHVPIFLAEEDEGFSSELRPQFRGFDLSLPPSSSFGGQGKKGGKGK